MTQNLLLQKDKDNLKTGYRYRKIVVYSIMASFTFLIVAIIFLPILFTTKSRMDNMTQNQSANESALNEQKDILSMPSKVNKNAEVVLSFKTVSTISDKISKIEKTRNEGISLNNLTYNTKNIIITGIAKDRGSLLAFEKALKEINFIKSTSIPVSNFAKDFDLLFTINVSLDPSK